MTNRAQEPLTMNETLEISNTEDIKTNKRVLGSDDEQSPKRTKLASDKDNNHKEKESDMKDDADSKQEDDLERSICTFPERLMSLLDQEVEKEAMWWLEDGDGFFVRPKLFADRVLNKYFQGTKFESFTRKLNRWGFKRAAGQHVPPNTIAYYHNLFQRGKPELLKKMSGGKKRDGSGGNEEIMASGLSAEYGNPRAAALQSQTPGIANAPMTNLGAYGLMGGGGLGFPSGNPLDNELRIQSYLLQQQNAELARQQQARLLAAEFANDQRRALATGPGNRMFQNQGAAADLTSRMLLAAARSPGPLSLTSIMPPGANPGQYDQNLLQLLLERQREQERM